MYKFIFECYSEYSATVSNHRNYCTKTKTILKKFNSIKIKVLAIDEKSAEKKLDKIKGNRSHIKLLEIESL